MPNIVQKSIKQVNLTVIECSARSSAKRMKTKYSWNQKRFDSLSNYYQIASIMNKRDLIRDLLQSLAHDEPMHKVMMLAQAVSFELYNKSFSDWVRKEQRCY